MFILSLTQLDKLISVVGNLLTLNAHMQLGGTSASNPTEFIKFLPAIVWNERRNLQLHPVLLPFICSNTQLL